MLLIPYTFWYLLGIAIAFCVFYGFGIKVERAHSFNLLSALFEFITIEDSPNSPIWFLLCLFTTNVIFYLVYNWWNQKAHGGCSWGLQHWA